MVGIVVQFCLPHCRFRNNSQVPLIDDSCSKFRMLTLNNQITNILNGVTAPLIKVTAAVSVSNSKNDTAGIKYVECNGTIEQVQ